MTHVVLSACIGVKDGACVQVCPVDCFFDGGEMLFIHPDECIDCGACIDACPVHAIQPEDDVRGTPEEPYIAMNRSFFAERAPAAIEAARRTP